MNIFTKAIVSNSDMIKKYKGCREKAEEFGKIFIMKNNQPDAVLFSKGEYERISELIEYLESLDDIEVESIMKTLPKEGIRKKYSIDELREDLRQIPKMRFNDESIEGTRKVNGKLEAPIKVKRMELKKAHKEASDEECISQD